LADQVLAEVRAWRAAHPRATLREIEQAVDGRLAAARARLVAAAAAADADPAADPPGCPACGAAMADDGPRTRRLRTAHEQVIALTRSYARCPRCGTGLFPPG
jgi:ribosomal protein S27AE